MSDRALTEQMIRTAGEGDTAVARSLLQRGADVNGEAVGRLTALRAAAGQGHLDTVKMLLDMGADIKASNGAGQTAEDMARAGGHAQVADFLHDRIAAATALAQRQRLQNRAPNKPFRL